MTMIESSTRRDFRHTKIVCTLGPATSDTETLRSLANAGMNIARFNMSHGDHASHLALFEKVKGLNQVLNHPIGLLLDTQGPEIRTGERDSPLHLEVGAHITLTVSPEEDPEEQSVHVKYPDLVNDLKVGDRVTVDNGLINLEVLEINAPRMRCKVIDGGKLGSRRHVNLPGIRVNLPSITDKDRADIEFGLKQGIDYIALSFVRSPDDIAACRKLVEAHGGTAKIYAKIENQEGMDNFDQILEAADGIMVARGDLGVEIPIRELPHSQRQMVRKCIVAAKPVIVATHLLESMINNPMPTRAEVSDVANAVYEGADAIMLSGETSAGQFPLRCVQTLDSIARRQEKEPMLGFHLERRSHGVRDKLARHAVQLAESLGSHAILVITRRGTTAQLVSAYRPSRAIIYAFTNQESVRNKLWMIRSVVPMHTDLFEDPEKTVQASMLRLRERNRLLPGDPVVVVSDIEAGEERVTTIQVRKFR